MITNADDAFDNLLGRNALGIPVASPAPEARGGEGPTSDTVPLPGIPPRPVPAPEPPSPAAFAHTGPKTVSFANGSAGGDMSEAMRVLDLLDASGSDYSPRDYGPEEGEHLFTTPTEMDLDPVDGDAETPSAHKPSVVVLRKTASGPDISGDATRAAPPLRDDASPAGSDTVIAEPEGEFAVNAELRKARRFRRFSYLPLGGMEHFENRARDIMASLASQDPDRPSLAVTCPFRGEGQAEVAIRLALAMAKRVGYRVLLADFNIREPQIAIRLGLSSKYFTLSDVLRGSCPLGEALMVSEEDNLYVLPARATDRVGDEVLNDRQVQALMARIHTSFDFAVISCGSADHADAAIACRHAGAAALAAFCRRSSAHAVREASENLAEAGARIVGMLLTGV